MAKSKEEYILWIYTNKGTNMNTNNCKGCRTYHELYPCCIPIGVKLLCPCVECIVKPICLTACQDFSDYEDSVKVYDYQSNSINSKRNYM